MSLEADDQARIDTLTSEADANGDTRRLVRNAAESQKIGPLTVICMILNRTFGEETPIALALQNGLTDLHRLWHLCYASTCAQEYRQCWTFSYPLVYRSYHIHECPIVLARTWSFNPQIQSTGCRFCGALQRKYHIAERSP